MATAHFSSLKSQLSPRLLSQFYSHSSQGEGSPVILFYVFYLCLLRGLCTRLPTAGTPSPLSHLMLPHPSDSHSNIILVGLLPCPSQMSLNPPAVHTGFFYAPSNCLSKHEVEDRVSVCFVHATFLLQLKWLTHIKDSISICKWKNKGIKNDEHSNTHLPILT